MLLRCALARTTASLNEGQPSDQTAPQAHGKTFKYDGQKLDLTPAQEEVATMFAAMISTDYATKDIFRTNFMASWRPLLKETGLHKTIKANDASMFLLLEAHGWVDGARHVT